MPCKVLSKKEIDSFFDPTLNLAPDYMDHFADEHGTNPDSWSIISIATADSDKEWWFKDNNPDHIRVEMDDVWVWKTPVVTDSDFKKHKIETYQQGYNTELSINPPEKDDLRPIFEATDSLPIIQKSRKPILVHCQAGVSRSTALGMVIRWLKYLYCFEHSPNKAARKAYNHTWQDRKHCNKRFLPNPLVLKHGEELAREVYDLNTHETLYLLRELEHWQSPRLKDPY